MWLSEENVRTATNYTSVFLHQRLVSTPTTSSVSINKTKNKYRRIQYLGYTSLRTMKTFFRKRITLATLSILFLVSWHSARAVFKISSSQSDFTIRVSQMETSFTYFPLRALGTLHLQSQQAISMVNASTLLPQQQFLLCQQFQGYQSAKEK